jgi:hypothetical protein
MNTGYLIHLSHLNVCEYHRRNSLCKRIVEATVQTIQGMYHGPLFVIASPEMLVTKLKADYGDAPYISAHQADIETIFAGFLRKADFRRVGHSPYFALAADPNHPCHQLAASDDPNLP